MNMDFERMFTFLLILTLLLATDAVARIVRSEPAASAALNNRVLTLAMSTVTGLKQESATRRKKSVVAQSINPHWDNAQCEVCHLSDDNSLSGLRLTESEGLCLDCHKDDITHTYIHPVGIKLPSSRKVRISKQWGEDLRLDDTNRLTCQTCHDLLDQCLPERSHQVKRNPRFLRGGPYPNRYTLCYRCHDSSKYERKNPHDQIADNGQLKTKMCRLCHDIDINKMIQSGIKKDIEQFPLLQGMNEDRTLLCVRCHRKIDHPSSAFRIKSDKKYRHLVKIPTEKKNTLEKQSLKTGIVLPLEPYTERIYCGTCHQPHQPGVFSGEERAPATMKNHRLRSQPICKHCHDIYGSILEAGK